MYKRIEITILQYRKHNHIMEIYFIIYGYYDSNPLACLQPKVKFTTIIYIVLLYITNACIVNNC